MKNDKRVKRGLALILTAALLVPNGAYAASAKDFSDFPCDWSATAMSQAVENGLLGGYDGKINPQGKLSRAEMATIVNRAFGATEKADMNGYKDVKVDAWYYDDMAKAVQMGTFVGAEEGRLYPSQYITREEAFVVLARAFEVSEGDSRNLVAYSDAAEVSAWARDTVAGLVAEGYISGYGGKLAPKAPISRAEFAAMMSKLVSSYVTEASTVAHDIEGNLVVRSADVTLKDMTIDGDLILADGIGDGEATLDNVTVNGRVIVRGGGVDSVHFNHSTVQGKLILNDRNGTTRLVEKDSKLGEAVLYSDAILEGHLDKVTVTAPIDVVVADGQVKQLAVVAVAKDAAIEVQKNATVKALHIQADGVVVDGKGLVNQVQADANHIKVLTEGTTVHAGAGTVGVMAGAVAVQPGSSGTVGNQGEQGKPDGNAGGGSGGGSTGGQTDGGKEELTQGTLVQTEKAQIVQTDAGAWLPLVFAKGVDSDDVRLYVDGKDVTKAMSKVMSDGSVAKLPLVGNPGSVTIHSDRYTQTIKLGNEANAKAVYTGNDYLPDYFLAHGPISVWDYYLTNYDDNGKVRVLPSATTFGNKQLSTVHPAYSPVAILDEGNASGTVEIMFNYISEADKAWFDGVADSGALSLVSYDQYKTTLNKQLTYEKTTADHHGNTVGMLKVPFGQSNFKSNGRYYVRVATSGEGGKTTYQMVPIHVVNHDAPTLKVQETPESGRNLHFEVNNMLYGISDPIEQVVLTKPSGKTVTLNKINDYFLMSQDLFILYNDVNATNGTNHLDEIGNYTLTIQAAGFQDFGCTFNVGGSVVATQKAKAASVDAISSATSGGGSSGGSSEGGSMAIQANLVFDGDLLANALVLEKIGQETSAASTVLDYWKSNVIADAVFDIGDTSYYKWSDFISTVNSAQTKNQFWVPFASYRQDANASVHPPHATKALLEDGLLGELQDASVSGKLETPSVEVSHNKQGQDPVLTFSGKQTADYLDKVKEVRLNGDYRPLDSQWYAIDAEKGTVTLQSKCLTVGANTLLLQAEGYKPLNVTVDYHRVLEEGLSLQANASAEKVVLTIKGSEGDFLKSLQSVVLTKDGGKDDVVRPQGVEGSNAVYYVMAKDHQSLELYNVKPGDYMVRLNANGYADSLTAPFNVTGETLALPTPDMTMKGQNSDFYQIAFSEKAEAADHDAISNWFGKLQSVSVNGQAYTAFEGLLGNPTASSSDYSKGVGGFGESLLKLGGAAFNQEKNTVVIQSEGYEALTVTVNKDGSIEGESTIEPETPSITTPTVNNVELVDDPLFDDYYRIGFTVNDQALNTYLKTINTVTVDGSDLQKNAYFNGGVKAYRTQSGDDFTGNLWYLHLSKSSIAANGTSTVVVSATGYDDLTLHFKDGQYLGNTVTTPKPELGGDGKQEDVTVPKVADLAFHSSVLNSFHRLSFENADGALVDYLKKVTEITVDGEPLHQVSGFWGETLAYKMSNDDALGGDICFIDLTSDCIKHSGSATIVIKADGYPNMTVQVQDGVLVQ